MQELYIQDNTALEECMEHLEEVSEFAIDLEFDKNRYAYGFNMCLMQIATQEKCFLIDPLAPKLDIHKIFPLLEREDKELITYSFDEDLRLLHSMGCFPKRIFDTGTVFTLLNNPASSLTNVLDDILGVTLSSSKQKSNWMKRPLSSDQLSYAADDVLYLLELKNNLYRQAEEKGITSWLEEEFNYLSTLDYSQVDNRNFLKDKDRRLFTPFEWHSFEALMLLREDKAMALHKPAYQVLDGEFIKELAQNPKQIKQFDQVRQVHRSLRNNQFKQEIKSLLDRKQAEAKAQGLAKTGNALPKLERSAFQKMKQVRQELEKAKIQLFKPIQQDIAATYGEHVQRQVISNKMVEYLVKGNRAALLPYKQKILLESSKILNLDINKYLN